MNKKLSYKVGGTLAVFAVVLSPVMAGAVEDTSVVQATVNSVISVESAATVAISVTPDADGEVGSASDTVTVSTNDPQGYDLTLKNDATVTMSDGSGNTLAATAAAHGTPGALDLNSWGYSLDSGTSYAGVTETAHNIKSTSATASADTTTVTYGVNVDTSKPAGVYSDSVTYTATVK